MTAAQSPSSGQGPAQEEERHDGDRQRSSRRPHGAVLITVTDDGPGGSPFPASSKNGLEAALLVDHAAVAHPEDEEEPPRPQGKSSFSLWRATVAVLVLAALAAAGYVCLYEGGDYGAAWRFLEASEEEDEGEDMGGPRSFLLPLYPKPRRGSGAAENLTAAAFPSTGNVFSTGYVQLLRLFLQFRNSVHRLVPFAIAFSNDFFGGKNSFAGLRSHFFLRRTLECGFVCIGFWVYRF